MTANRGIVTTHHRGAQIYTTTLTDYARESTKLRTSYFTHPSYSAVQTWVGNDIALTHQWTSRVIMNLRCNSHLIVSPCMSSSKATPRNVRNNFAASARLNKLLLTFKFVALLLCTHAAAKSKKDIHTLP